jgi:hypothetical protein
LKVSDYKWILAVYTYYIKLVLVNRKDFDRKYVYKATELEEFKKDFPVFEFDEHFLEKGKTESKVKSKKEKAANIIFT